jgi:hypothetical protein
MNAFARQVFYPGDRPLRAGERLRQPDLAKTLALYAQAGPAAIYEGGVAEAIVAELAAAPIPADPSAEGSAAEPPRVPWMTLADLSRYEIEEREPLHGWFRGMEIVTMPPPSSGGIVLLQALGILEGMPLDAEKNRSAARARDRARERRPRGRRHPAPRRANGPLVDRGRALRLRGPRGAHGGPGFRPRADARAPVARVDREAARLDRGERGHDRPGLAAAGRGDGDDAPLGARQVRERGQPHDDGQLLLRQRGSSCAARGSS